MNKILGIKIHYTWIFAFVLVTATVTTQFSEEYLLYQRIILGIAVSLLYLLSAVIREFILAVFIREIPFSKITLFAFGGVYQENRDRIAASYHPLLYVARFLSNLVIAAIFYGLFASFINAGNQMMAVLAQWLTYIYFTLFLLHFIPAFPLDGGKILRMILWKSPAEYYRATHIASLVGWAIGLFLIFAGVLVFILTLQWLSLAIVYFGWIVEIAAGYTRYQVQIHMVLQHVKAEDIMNREYPALSRQTIIRQLIKEHILKKGWHYVVVVDEGKLGGIVTLNQIKAVPVKRCNDTIIGEIMTPADRLETAHSQQTADLLLEDMYQRSIDYIPVMEKDNIIGVVSKNALMALVKTRHEFGV